MQESSEAMLSRDKEAYWRKHVMARQTSGLRIKAYCYKHGLSYSQYKYWQYKLFPKVSKPANCLAEPATAARDDAVRDLSFEKVTLRAPLSMEQGCGISSGVTLSIGAMTLVISQGFCQQTLLEVISCLKDCSC